MDAMSLHGWSGFCRHRPERCWVSGKTVTIKFDWITVSVLSYQSKLAVIGHENQTIVIEILRYLCTLRCQPGVISDALDLNDSTLWDLALTRLTSLYLILCIETEIGIIRTLVAELAIANYLGL